MTGLWLALLLAAQGGTPVPRSVTLFDDAVKVGASKIRTLDVDLPVEPARIVCTYEVLSGGSGVRVVLLKQEDAQRWLRGEAHHVEASTPFGRGGAFSHRPTEPDRYEIVLDNRMEGRGPAEVHLLVRLLYGESDSGPVRHAEPRKGLALVWSSMLLFAAIAATFTFHFKQSLDRQN
ncbi:hypothetical protein [uncultured Paludibaculum sp.]|uniref:hypothetical protein n=1 Tax=uncultured Paludibaculum sp. TaxID=1765020 RepID=UPI002AAAD036|nr:hypothetical protein [uncultured Paludibaculum sp.]